MIERSIQVLLSAVDVEMPVGFVRASYTDLASVMIPLKLIVDLPTVQSRELNSVDTHTQQEENETNMLRKHFQQWLVFLLTMWKLSFF